MSDFRWTTTRGRGIAPNGRIVAYKTIARYVIPDLEFPDEESAAAWEDELDYFESEFSRFGELQTVVLANGRRMLGCEYKFYLADWIYNTALELGADISGEALDVESANPEAIEGPAPKRAPVMSAVPESQDENIVGEAFHKQAEAQRQASKEISEAFGEAGQ